MLFIPLFKSRHLKLFTMENRQQLRQLLLEQLEGRQAHVDFRTAVKGLKLKDVGTRPSGFDHNSYHIGQIVQLRKVMGLWQPL